MELSSPEFELFVLRIHLLVGMSAADEQIDMREREHIYSFIDGSHFTQPSRKQLAAIADDLFDDPPRLHDLLRKVMDHPKARSFAPYLVADLTALAHADGVPDPREEGMLRMVCGALHIDPESIYAEEFRAKHDVSAQELADFVRSIVFS